MTDLQPGVSDPSVNRMRRIRGDSVERRNFVLNAVEGILFISSAGFASFQTVLPALVTRLGGGNVVVGLLPVIVYGGTFLPQIFAARHVSSIPWKKPWTLTYGFFQRSFLLVSGILVWVFGLSQPGTALALFLACYFLATTAGGIASPSWFDLFAKLTPTGRRGRLVGIRSSVGGGFAMLCGIVLTWILATVPFPSAYAVAIILASLLQFSSLLIQINLAETEQSLVLPRKALIPFVRELLGVLRTNVEFGRFITACMFLILATVPVGFFTVCALERFHGGELLVGQFTLAMVGSQMVSALVAGLVADRFGNRVVLIGISCALLCACVTALFASSPEWFIVVYFFVGVQAGSDIMTRYNMAIEYCTPEQRSAYIALMNTVLAPLYAAGIIGGIISERLGFDVLFGVGVLCTLVGLFLLIFRVREPRTLSAGA